MRVAFTPRARADLNDILNYIKADSPIAARKYVDALQAKALGLRRFPKRYAVRDGLPDKLRAATHRSHLIVFRIHSNCVEIVRVVHGAMDLKRIFGAGT